MRRDAALTLKRTTSTSMDSVATLFWDEGDFPPLSARPVFDEETYRQGNEGEQRLALRLCVVIKKAFKSALGVPERTPTERLMKLGVHNTLEELKEAHIATQLKRLDGTANGSRTLPSEDLPREVRAKIKVSRIPRNMHPEANADWRRARSKALGRTWDRRSGTVYVDAAQGQDGIAMVAVSSSDGTKTISVASLKDIESAARAEEVAIALAIACNPRATVVTDSQAVNFAAGSIGPAAARLLRKYPPESVHVMRTPGHVRHGGNEAAHVTVRGLLPSRASPSRGDGVDDEASRRFPLPLKSLSREEHLIRRLQTDSLPTPDRLNAWYQSSHPSPACTHCGCERADAYHVVWACQKIPGLQQIKDPMTERWEAALRSEDASQQLLVVNLLAREAVGSKKAP
ncbi:hypothetical protein HPB47_015362 [Ixodes persulcatus]|uniref:Uncharacterized protein n=1 Tax=Ixodes persulcatus TaxID=34615 RepID=A0AC60QUX7_IXOPE|nr:hypothetical protein HPB47_015362 [Ixodes persulcatus]